MGAPVHTSDAGGEYLAECYWPGVTADAVAAAAARVQTAADELSARGRDVRFLGSLLIADDETVFWLFGGNEPDVRAAGKHAGVRFERVLASLRIDRNPARKETR